MLGTLLLLVLLATCVSTLATHYFLLSSIINKANELGRYPTGREIFNASIAPLIIIIPVVLIVSGIIVIFISHRIAGPLYRLKMYMEKLGKGDFSIELKFRQFDEIHDVADCFNKMVENLRRLKNVKP
jgi:nitrate/nitrite-specific signal transduction histidine kinase